VKNINSPLLSKQNKNFIITIQSYINCWICLAFKE